MAADNLILQNEALRAPGFDEKLGTCQRRAFRRAYKHRAITSIPPDEACPRKPWPADSTRFMSNVDRLDTIQRATQRMDATSTNAVTVDMGGVIGEGYRAGGRCPVTTTKATVIRGPSGIITAYPELGTRRP
jgi:hypothetical protein